MGGGGYTYAVPGQWQGRFEKLQVIGDKSKTAQDVVRLTSRPALLDRLAAVTAVRIRLIHVIRSPFDTIATRSMRRKRSVAAMAGEYFALCERLRRLIERVDAVSEYDVARIPLHLEDLVADPETELGRLCDRLGVPAKADHLRACAGIVYPQIRKSRHEVAWNGALVCDIERKLAAIPFLTRYSFDG